MVFSWHIFCNVRGRSVAEGERVWVANSRQAVRYHRDVATCSELRSHPVKAGHVQVSKAEAEARGLLPCLTCMRERSAPWPVTSSTA